MTLMITTTHNDDNSYNTEGTNFMLFIPWIFLQLKHQPAYALNKIQVLNCYMFRHGVPSSRSDLEQRNTNLRR